MFKHFICRTIGNGFGFNQVKIASQLGKLNQYESRYALSTTKDEKYSKKLKTKRKELIQKYIDSPLPNEDLENSLKSLKETIKSQGNLIRSLKSENSSKESISAEVSKLESLKSEFEEKISHLLVIEKESFNEFKFNDLVKKRFFYDHSFSLYNSGTGSIDFGPIGCSIQSNIVNEWRKFFVIKENMLQVDCSIVTPEEVLKASGHLSKFSDFLVRDSKTNEGFRADHLLKSELKKVKNKNKNAKIDEVIKNIESGNIGANDIDKIIAEYNIRSPNTGNALTKTEPFNLMFQTIVGPTGNLKGYLRPETAQGIFVNFKNLLRFNQNKLPMVVAQIGKSFRNEISPKSGLIRQREFLMAEIEHFLNPKQKYEKYDQFKNVQDCTVSLLTAENQEKGLENLKRVKLRDAIDMKIIKSEVVAFYLGKIYLFAKKCGIKEEKMRFRQHTKNEMAHYAEDCWDLECETSYGWIECVGVADRSDYDLRQHTEHSVAGKVSVNESKLKDLYKEDFDVLKTYFSKLSNEELLELGELLEKEGRVEIKIGKKMYSLNHEILNFDHKTESGGMPHVIEPSFGIGRLLYTTLEHNFCVRSDEKRCYFSLPVSISPYQCAILPLTEADLFKEQVSAISELLSANYISHHIDQDSGTIGKRYCRADEIAVPFAITIDYDSLNKPHTVTIRERDSMQQIRIETKKLIELLNDLINERMKWEDAYKLYGNIKTKQDKPEEDLK